MPVSLASSRQSAYVILPAQLSQLQSKIRPSKPTEYDEIRTLMSIDIHVVVPDDKAMGGGREIFELCPLGRRFNSVLTASLWSSHLSIA